MITTTKEPENDVRPEDRRAHARIRFRAEVHFGSLSNFYTGLTRDISEGGVFIATYNNFPVGTLIDLALKLPDSDVPMNIKGEVRWMAEYSIEGDGHPGLGIRFVGLSPEEQQRIERFTRMRDSIFYDE